MRTHILSLALCLAFPVTAFSQWTIQDSHTTADLHSVTSLGGGIAWVSGSDGVVLRTQNNGQSWETCNSPSKSGHDDFRAIQATDANTAIVMSSGKGPHSKIYKTTDGCKTWKMAFENPDETGSFANLLRISDSQFYLLGQPVDGKFSMFLSQDSGATWFATSDPGLEAVAGETVSAESNAAIHGEVATLSFGTMGTAQPHIYSTYAKCDKAKQDGSCSVAWAKIDIPIVGGNAAAGVTSLSFRTQLNFGTGAVGIIGAAVGGNAEKPDDASSTAAYTANGKAWLPAKTMPGGYRSAIAYDKTNRTWIAVGPNGTDISNDDGKNWQALNPAPGEAPDAAKNWTAISIPFAVGPHGRIGIRSKQP